MLIILLSPDAKLSSIKIEGSNTRLTELEKKCIMTRYCFKVHSMSIEIPRGDGNINPPFIIHQFEKVWYIRFDCSFTSYDLVCVLIWKAKENKLKQNLQAFFFLG